MISLRVLDEDLEAVKDQVYDVSLFASGYESRCTYIPRTLNKTCIRHPLILGFIEESKSKRRADNDSYFSEAWSEPILLSGDDEKPIYDHLRQHLINADAPVRILVDYSSMSRLWYAAVLNWARFGASGREVVIDFVYSMGRYDEEKHPMVIRSMVSIPGCEGRAFRMRESVAVFGLGFHGLAALCVLDHLEADAVYAFLGATNSAKAYVDKTRESNRELIEHPKTKALLEWPLESLETAYRQLAETVAPHRPDGEITLVPMGPKPQVLASILVAMRFQEVACLRVGHSREALDVIATGDTIATRVIIKGER